MKLLHEHGKMSHHRQRLIIKIIKFAHTIGIVENDGVVAGNDDDDRAKLEKLVDLKLNTWS